MRLIKHLIEPEEHKYCTYGEHEYCTQKADEEHAYFEKLRSKLKRKRVKEE